MFRSRVLRPADVCEIRKHAPTCHRHGDQRPDCDVPRVCLMTDTLATALSDLFIIEG